MAIHRKFLYAGLFLVALGGVMVAVDLNAANAELVRSWLRLWPLVFIAIGLAIVVRRTRVSLPAGMLAAVAPGLLLGGGIVAGPRVAVDCSDSPPPALTSVSEGELAANSAIELHTGCGTTKIGTAVGSAWSVHTGASDGREPEVSSDTQSLLVTSFGRGGRQLVFGDRREAWEVTLPTIALEHLLLVANANEVDARLAGTSIHELLVEANASSIRLDATGSSIDNLRMELNFASTTVLLPSTRYLAATFDVNAGALRLCQPLGAGLRVDFHAMGPREVTIGGQPFEGDSWISDRDVLAQNQLEVTVDATFSRIDINPIGGC